MFDGDGDEDDDVGADCVDCTEDGVAVGDADAAAEVAVAGRLALVLLVALRVLAPTDANVNAGIADAPGMAVAAPSGLPAPLSEDTAEACRVSAPAGMIGALPEASRPTAANPPPATVAASPSTATDVRLLRRRARWLPRAIG